MSHYDALGVGKNATPDEIKKAFRRKAREHHPDREGGDSRAMVAVNKAYECLSDPKKREYYDRHGGEQTLNTIEQQAMGIIYQILLQLIEEGEEGDFVNTIVANLRQNIANTRAGKSTLERAISKAERQRKCIRRKHGKENLLDLVFTQKIAALRAKIAEIPEAVALGEKALEIMADYENAFTQTAARHTRPANLFDDLILKMHEDIRGQFR